MSRNQVVFILIIGAALAIVVVGVALQGLSGSEDPANDNNNTSTSVPAGDPITVEIAVNSVIEPWITEAVDAYNRTNPRVNNRPVTVRLTRRDSIDVWSASSGGWSAASHPLAWIPEASYVVEYARDPAVGLRYEIAESSVAQTPMIWGAYTSRSDIILTRYGEFTASTLQQAAVAESWEASGGNQRWGFIKLAFSRPDRTGSGMAALFALAGEFGSNPALADTLMNDPAFRAWLEPFIDSVPNFSTLGTDPAQVMSTRGTSTADMGLLPESQWLIHFADLNNTEPFQLFYPSNYLLLDFPYTIWDGTETTADERRAAEAFGSFLVSEAQQRAAGEKGFRPVGGGDLTQYTPFNVAQGVFQPALAGSEIAPPSRPAALNLLRWFSSTRTAP